MATQPQQPIERPAASELISLDAAAEYAGWTGRAVAWRYAREGVRPRSADENQPIIRLQVWDLSTRCVRTTRAAVDQFIAAVSAATQAFYERRRELREGDIANHTVRAAESRPPRRAADGKRNRLAIEEACS